MLEAARQSIASVVGRQAGYTKAGTSVWRLPLEETHEKREGGGQGARPVADAVLKVGLELGHRPAPMARHHENGIVPEPVLPSWLKAYLSFAGASRGMQRPIRFGNSNRAPEPGRALALRHALQSTEEFTVAVRVI